MKVSGSRQNFSMSLRVRNVSPLKFFIPISAEVFRTQFEIKKLPQKIECLIFGKTFRYHIACKKVALKVVTLIFAEPFRTQFQIKKVPQKLECLTFKNKFRCRIVCEKFALKFDPFGAACRPAGNIPPHGAAKMSRF